MDFKKIEKQDIHCYRGTETGTTIYMKDGSEIVLNDDFDTVDNHFDLLTPYNG